MTELDVRPTHLLDELARNGALRTTGLFLNDPNISYEQLEAVGGLLGRMHQSLRFAIGDWLLLMETMFPDKFSQAAEVLGISAEGMREYLRVSQQVPRSIRREKLSWSHHRAVASLSKVNKDGNLVSDVNSQKQWLERAETENLSHHQLRDALRTEEPPDPGVCRCCHRPYDR
jgi:hypothetical protein